MRAQDAQDVVARNDEPDEQSHALLHAVENGDPDSGWSALPLALYSEETHLGLGAFAIHHFHLGHSERPSSIALVGFGTTRGQAVVELIPEFYLDEGRWHFWSKLEFRYFPDTTWGVGPDTPDSAEEDYDQLSSRLRMWLRREVVPGLFIGFRTDALYLEVNGIADDGLFQRGRMPGSEGGLTMGFGSTVSWDTRDLATESRSGSFYQLGFTFWPPFLAVERHFARFSLDLRQFFDLGNAHALGLQLYGETNFGDVPFYHMATIGGPNRMRGFFEGRYRDQSVLTLQAEYRFPIYWRFRGVVFAAAGDVAPTVWELDPESLEIAGGAGLRFALDETERLNVRLDFGVSPESWGVYVNVGEAF